MPLRILIILAILLATTFGLLTIAWQTESELYFFMPTFQLEVHRPPTHPAVVLLMLGIVIAVTLMSRHYGMRTFILFALGMVLGTAVGILAFEWTPSLCQYLLTFAASTAALYSWIQRDYFDY